MKKSLCLVSLMILLGSSFAAQAILLIPSVVGVWKGTAYHAGSSEGYMSTKVKLVIQNQKGRLFRGYLVGEGMTDVNYVVGSLEESLSVSGGWDVSFSMSSTEGTKIVGTALLTTLSSPWKLTRLALTGHNNDTGPHGNLVARGTLRKQ